MVESHDIKANEKGYHSLTLNFKDHNLKKYYSIQTKKFLISRKNIIGRLSMIQYLILISGLLVITYHQNKRDHEIITLICTAYASILLIHRIILNLDYLDFLNKITNFSLPLSNTIFLLFCLIYSQDDNFNSFVAFYALVISILFQSEYIDTFIGYLCISLILFTIFLMK